MMDVGKRRYTKGPRIYKDYRNIKDMRHNAAIVDLCTRSLGIRQCRKLQLFYNFAVNYIVYR